MTQNASSQNSICFPPFELDPGTGELRKHGTRLKLSGQAMRVLTMLAAAPGEMVSREALKRALWPGATSGDFEHGLNAAVNRLREILGDSATDPEYIETIPGRGYRFIGRISGEEQSVPVAAPPAERKNKRRIALAATAAGLVLVIGLLLLRTPIERTWRIYQLQRLTVVRLTSLPGNVASPSFSPDGSQLAFAWDPDGSGFDLYVKALGSDEPHRLTHHPSARFSVAWSPNGRSIATARVAGDDDSGIYVISPAGGPERKVADRSERTWYDAELTWSPDAKQIAFVDRPANANSEKTLQIFLLTMDSLEKTPVDTGCTKAATPSFSPRGDALAWVCNRGMCASGIEVMRLSDHRRSEVYHGQACILGLAWSPDERRIVFSTSSDSGALREIELTHSWDAENISIGQDAADLARRPMGGGFAYVKGSYSTNIRRMGLSASPPEEQRMAASSQNDRAPSLAPDESRIAFESDRSGSTEVWICDADGSNAQQLSFFNSISGTPRWSPDGKLIVFDSRAEGEANLYVVNPSGGAPRKVNIDRKGNSQPSWSHDGRWLYFMNGDDEGRPTIWKAPSGGGHAMQLSGEGGVYPQESADGALVYFVRGGALWSVDREGGVEQRVESFPQMNFLGDEWFPSERGIYFLAHHNTRTSVELFVPKTKRVRTLFTAKQTPPWIGSMSVSKDGKSILFPEIDFSSSDIMMVENWR